MVEIGRCVSEDVVWRRPGRAKSAGETRGRDAFLAGLALALSPSGGGYHIDLHDVLASDDHVAALFSLHGQRRGRELQIRLIVLFEVRDGQVVRATDFADDTLAFEKFWSD